MNKRHVFIDSAAINFLDQVKYTFSEISVRLGVSFVLHRNNTTRKTFDLHYGVLADKRSKHFIKFDADCYSQQPTGLNDRDIDLIISHSHIEKNIDLIGLIFRLLTLADEQTVQEKNRNEMGIFLVSALSASRRKYAEIPLVEYAAGCLKSIFGLDNAQIWPNGKKWVLVSTHDTDAVTLSNPYELCVNAIKAISRMDGNRLNMFIDGCANIFKRVEENPLFGFNRWADAERKLKIRGAFFLFCRTRAFISKNDCKSSVQVKGFNWDILRSLHDEGWEFALHPSINAKDSLDDLVCSKEYIESRLNTPIFGTRHHYWSIDWRSPHLTLHKLQNAGFKYDNSFAWRDSLGFRAATCLPFNFYDPGLNTALQIYSIPSAVMDGHLTHWQHDEIPAVTRINSFVEEVRKLGGVCVLDWHTEASSNKYHYRNDFSLWSGLMSRVTALDDVWVTTPWNLTKYWHAQTKKYQVFLGD